jgi:soluble lytic murein transglycosylase-like protein
VASRIAFGVLAAALLTGSAATAQTIDATGGAGVRVLSAADVERYRTIFAEERAGRFAAAKASAERLDDNSLEGYVLAERYLSPRGKRVPVTDLVSWLRNYGELPVAENVYRLAVKRSTKKVRRHHHTVLVAVVTNIPVPGPTPHHRGGGYEDVDIPDPPFASDAARTASVQIEQLIKTDQPDAARNVLQSLYVNYAPALDIARLAHRVAASYLAEGMDQQAYDLVTNVGDTERASVPLLDWDAGLAAYRLGRFQDAAQHFERLAQVGSVPNWTRSGAAFWAARAHAQGGDPQRVVTLLEAAAKCEPTFYGLIAEKILGEDTETGFADPVVNAEDFAELMRNPAAHRAVALWQIGDRDNAIYELNRAFGESDGRADATFAAIARRFDAPNLELRASETTASRGTMLTGLFPVPQYRPDDGYRIDPSLVLAFARVESRFQTEATSPAGAKGLMQLMPATANHLGGPGAAERLYDASYNLSLGQRFIEHMLGSMNGNLVEVAAAYNAGPGAISRWVGAKGSMMQDPLLFIESMPAAETRAYVKRMLAYHWMYHRRLGREAVSLDETASGGWPIYHPTEAPASATRPQAPAADTRTTDAGPSS